jgi:membrane-bound lytic murein transglycosylase D
MTETLPAQQRLVIRALQMCRAPQVGVRARTAALAAVTLVLGACATGPGPAAPDEAALAAASAASAASAPIQIASPAAAASEAGATIASPPDSEPVESGAAVGQPTDPLRPEEPVDLAEEAARRDLWVRVRQGFAMPDLDTDLVRGRERYYASRPDYVQRMTERSNLYLFHIVEEVERRGLPTELALLPFIESAFNPVALSSAKASGIWQFMPKTGKHYDLAQNFFRDERRDVLASTRAALDYLQMLHARFGDWHLALAAYNWGEGSVGRAIAKNRKAGRPTDYLSLKMPAETRLYVPKLQAMKNIVAQPETFGLVLPPIENHPYFLSVPIQRDMDVELVAELAGLPIQEFHALNPSLKQPVILAAGTPQVLLPYDNANAFVRALPDHVGPLASWTAWVVPRTMKTADAAKQLGMTETQLREINRIPPRMRVRAGSTLLVPRNGKRDADVSERIADSATILLSPESQPGGRRTTIKARTNESVTEFAQRLGLSAASVARWNDVSAGARFKLGQRVVVELPPNWGKPRSSSTRKTARGKTARPAAAANKGRVAKPSR